MTNDTMCERCKFYALDRTTDIVQGVCHRYPPTSILNGDQILNTFPMVRPTMWCGEFSAA